VYVLYCYGCATIPSIAQLLFTNLLLLLELLMLWLSYSSGSQYAIPNQLQIVLILRHGFRERLQRGPVLGQNGHPLLLLPFRRFVIRVLVVLVLVLLLLLLLLVLLLVVLLFLVQRGSGGQQLLHGRFLDALRAVALCRHIPAARHFHMLQDFPQPPRLMFVSHLLRTTLEL
jgi:hypothetical protein